MPPPDAVLLDFNGVLVDDEHLHLAAFNEVLAPLEVRMTDEAYAERYLGYDDRGAFEAVLADHGRAADPALIAQLIARKAAVYAQRAATELRVFPGAAALVAHLAARTPVGIVSGALRSEIEGALAVMGVRPNVALIVAAEDTAACKPDPEGYRTGLVRLAERFPSVRPAAVVAVEDSVAGIAAARGAQLTVVAVAHTYEPGVLARAGAHATVPTIADVTDDVLARALDARGE